MTPRLLLGTAAILVAGVLAVVGWRWLTAADGTALTGADAPGTVILIPGYGGGTGSLGALAADLQAQGRTVVVAEIGDGHGDISGYGRQVAAMTSAALAGGAPSVDLVGYSMGGLIARAAASDLPTGVRRVATIASPHGGTSLAGLGAFIGGGANCPTACQEMAPGSDFLDALPVAGGEDRWLSVWSAADEVVRPADSSSLSGATNIEVDTACATPGLNHGAIIASPVVADLVATFLATGQVSPSCRG